MKNYLRILSAVALVAASSGIFFSQRSHYTPRTVISFRSGNDMRGAAEYIFSRRCNPLTRDVDVEDVDRARRHADALASANKTESGMTLWWEELGPDNVGGRTRSFCIDRNNPNRLYTGGVSGGFWVSDDAGASWKKYNDMTENLAVASITQAVNGDIYFGTGEGLYGNWGNGSGGITGQGIWKSTDGGVTFKRLAATWDSASTVEKNAYANVNRMAVDPVNPQKIYAATKKGLRITYDGGSKWYNPVKLTAALFNTSICTDVDVSKDGLVIIAIGNQLYRSFTGDTGSFTRVYGNLPSTDVGRLEFAIAPTDPAYMYCAAAGSNGLLLNIYQSTDSGTTWNVIGDGSDSFFSSLYGSNGQGIYNNCVTVDPQEPKKAYFGGLDLYSYTDTVWKKISTSGGGANYVHSDNHFIYFHPSGFDSMYVVNDGGVFLSTDRGVTFDTSNNQYRVTQFYSVASSISGEVMGGTQDNGTQYIDFKGKTPAFAKRINGGDGAYTDFSRIDTNAFFVSSQLGAIRRSPSKGSTGSFKSFFDSNIAPDPSLVGKSYAFSGFVTPFQLWEKKNGNTPVDTTFAVGINGGVWVTKGAIDFSKTPRWYKVANVSTTPQCMDFSADGNSLFVGTSGGHIYRITGLSYVRDSIDTSGAGYDLTTNPNIIATRFLNFTPQTVTGVCVDPNNTSHIVVTLGNYGYTVNAFRCVNAMESVPKFTAVHNNLPPMPVYDAIIDRNNPSRYIAATELGIFMSEDSGATWSEQNAGMARVPTFMIRQQEIQTSGGPEWHVFIGTHGRGLFKTNTITGVNEKNNKPSFLSLSSLSIYPNPSKEKFEVTFSLPSSSEVTINLFDLSGKKVYGDDYKNRPAGKNTVVVETTGLKSGTYLVSVRAGNASTTGKIIIIN
jgi:photosystem II stability/assembly factor-like uncharacterized protein